jgi:hypothetical protein
MKFFWTSGLIAMSLLFSACDKKEGPKNEDKFAAGIASFHRTEISGANAEIRIFNKFGEPISGAQILIGDAQGTPFRGNFLSTDRNGVAVIPEEWTSAASITVDAKGYIRQTLLNQLPGNISIRLNTAYLPQYSEVSGKVTGLPVVDKDKLIDFALAMPLLTKSDLVYFDLGQVISPFSDTLSAAGQSFNLPSNVSLPKQKENYFISVTLEKPVFRLKTPTIGPKKFVATRGRFVFKTVVGELRDGKAFHEVINHFSILGAGVKDGVITGPNLGLDISGSDMSFTSQVNVNAVNAKEDEVALVLATSEVDGSMVPTDVKRTTNDNAIALQVLPTQPVQIINVIKKENEFMTDAPGSDRMTASILPIAATANNRLLPLISNPTISFRENYSIKLPELPVTSGIFPIAVSAVISDLAEIREGEKVIKTPIRKWEVIGYGWNQNLNLPKWPLADSNSRKRVEVKYIGSATSNAQNTLDFATHVTHASTDF